jgi:predicted permease
MSDSVSYLNLTFLTFSATLQTICLCLVGFAAAKSGVLPKKAQKYLSQLNMKIFTPSLIFIKLASKLSLSALTDLSVIPVFFAFSTLVAYGAARLTSRVLAFSRRERNFVIAMSVFGNTSSLPVPIVLALATTLPGLKWSKIVGDNIEDIASRSILYLVVYQQLALVLRWSWGYNTLLSKQEESFGEEVIEAKSAYQPHRSYSSTSNSSSNEDLEAAFSVHTKVVINVSGKETQPLLVKNNNIYSSPATNILFQNDFSESKDSKPSVVYLAWNWLMGVMNPPLWSVVASLLVALTPALKYQLITHTDGFLCQNVTSSIKQLANSAVPLILINLGASLLPSDDPENETRSAHPTELIVGSLVSRIFLPSVVILPSVALAAKYMCFSPILTDPVFILVAFILTITPPAVQISQICQINKVFEREMAGILFWGYVVIVLPVIIGAVLLASQVIFWVN